MKTTKLLLLAALLTGCHKPKEPVTGIIGLIGSNVEEQASGMTGMTDLEKHLFRDEVRWSNQSRIEFLAFAQMIDGSGAFTNPEMAKAMGLTFGATHTNWTLMVPLVPRTNGTVQEIDGLWSHWHTNNPPWY